MVPSTKLDGIALVVGGAKGIGQQTVYSLANAGAQAIVVADIDEEAAKETTAASKQYAVNDEYQAAVFKMDVSNADEVQKMVDFVVCEFGRIDYAVNSAGVANGILIHVADTDIDNFDRIMRVNARGIMLCVRAQAAAMRKQEPKFYEGRTGKRDIGRGAIVNVSSAHCFVGLPGKVSYTMSKHAVNGLTKMAGIDHAPEGIRCNAVCPSWVRTAIFDAEIEENPALEDEVAALPIKRVAEADEVSDTIAYLCSPAASYINGTSLVIDGSLTNTLRLH